MKRDFLRLEGLMKSFGGDEVLKGVSFSMNEGEVLVIIGSSGGGKTTLLRCLNFLTLADDGKIFLDGETLFDGETDRKIKEKELSRRRLHFGLVFQSFNLFPQYTAAGNVKLAVELQNARRKKSGRELLAEDAEAYALSLLERVGLKGKEGFYPHELSGGQQQRVAIARAMALKPEILCFDEPTSALDPLLTNEVVNVIKELKEAKMTMVIVTHDMEFAKKTADKVVFLSKGRVACEGTAEKVFSSNIPEIRSFIDGGK